MKDIFGEELLEGDVVAVTPKNYRGLVKATIIGFTAQNVRVEYNNTWNFGKPGKLEQYLVPPSSLVKKLYY